MVCLYGWQTDCIWVFATSKVTPERRHILKDAFGLVCAYMFCSWADLIGVYDLHAALLLALCAMACMPTFTQQIMAEAFIAYLHQEMVYATSPMLSFDAGIACTRFRMPKLNAFVLLSECNLHSAAALHLVKHFAFNLSAQPRVRLDSGLRARCI